MKPPEIFVCCENRVVWIMVEGNGSAANSRAMRDFAQEMVRRGSREFILDLSKCPAMDSTFMGTLVGISLSLGKPGEGRLSLVNLNQRNLEAITSLGLDQLFNVLVSTETKGGQALANPVEEDRVARARTILEAHEALIKTFPENLSKFKDVVKYLSEDLGLSK